MRHPSTSAALVFALTVGCSQSEPSPSAVARIVVSPGADTITVAQSVVLVARVEDAAGNPLSSRAVTWRSSAPAVAAVDGAGLLTPIVRGTTVITAESEGVSGRATVEVRDPFVSIAIDRRFPSVFAGDTITLTAAAVDSSGGSTRVTSARWSAADLSVAEINRQGITRAKTVGRTSVDVMLGALADTVDLAAVPKRIGANRGIAFTHYPGLAESVNEEWFSDGASRSRRVSAAGQPVNGATWSRDGSLLTVWYGVSDPDRQIGLVDPELGTEGFVPGGGGNPDLSPDNTRVAMTYPKPAPERNGIATIAIDGSDLRRLTAVPGEQLLPRWSPDGRQIAFMARQSDSPFWEVWTARADLSYPRRLATVTGLRPPEWSPDGRLLAIDDESRVWLLDPETKRMRSLTGLGDGSFPRWSPDGSKIVVAVGYSLSILRVNGDVVRSFESSYEGGALSPDGAKIAFLWHNSRVRFADLVGSGQSELEQPASSQTPLWRPPR